MLLRHLLDALEQPHTFTGPAEVNVRALRSDSRQVQTGDCFVAVRGVSTDGHRFVTQAIQQGAAAVVVERSFDLSVPPSVAVVRVQDSAEALGQLASAFFGHPSRRMRVLSVTGTNGKTTTTTLLYQLLSALGHKVGLIGTIENRIGTQSLPSTLTTPDSLTLHTLLYQMAEEKCTVVVMEASSHAIHQRRIAGIHFCGALFTNLTHDHLDYHKTFEAYRDAKKRLFDDLSDRAFALTNADDRNGLFMLQNTRAKRLTYALKTPADYKAKVLENSLEGLHMEIDGVQVHTRLIGLFNAYNLTAAYAIALQLGFPKAEVLMALSNVSGPEGRFEVVRDAGRPARIGIVDYAHTPDALQNVLETIVALRRRPARIFTVVGCGGDRDKAKRPLMAKAAARLSDQLILTSDNPRSEDPNAILQEMEAGLDPEALGRTVVIENREQAIKTACQWANPGDIVLVAGKGHEKYQEIQGKKYPFDDKAMLYKYLMREK